MIDYSKSYGYPRSCTLCGGGTYGHGLCVDCRVAFRVGRVVKTAAASFRVKDGQFQTRPAGAARFVDADIAQFDCACDECTTDAQDDDMLYAQTVDGRLVQVFSLDDARVDGVRVPMTPEQAHNPDVDAVARELIATANDGPVSTETHPYSHDCACDACTELLLNAQTCPHCSCFFVHHDHDVDACRDAAAIHELQFELDEVKDAIRESRGYEDEAFMQRLYSDRRSLEQRIAGLKDGTPQPVRQTAAIRMARERQAAMLDFDAEYGIPTPDFGRYS